MRARVVIGANFGDEGKGLMVDHLCSTEGAGVVVRFNGGAQAGHTVVTADDRRHVFKHVGSGTFHGIPTFLSQYFVVNPLLFFKETELLERDFGIVPSVFAHPECVVTTFVDMIINQRKEDKRGIDRHGSVGVGVHETMQRSEVPELRIVMADLWNGPSRLRPRLQEACGRWAKFRTGSEIGDAEQMIDAFLSGCEKFANAVHPAGIGQCKDPIFEGAQGLLLSQDNVDMRPHLTHSYTGLRNVRLLCAQAGIDDIETYFVSRTYLTRHGAGPLPGEDGALKYEDLTNVQHAYQGPLRFAPLEPKMLMARCTAEAAGLPFKIVLTHCDQQVPTWEADLLSYGPRASDIERVRR